MKKKRVILSVCACVCLVLSLSVVAITFLHTAPKHKHVLGEEKTYHICNDSIYYTRQCKDGCDVPFETKATLTDVFLSVTERDNIILDENVTLKEEVMIKTFSEQGDELELNVNLDLNNFTLSSNIQNKQSNSMFMFNSNIGKLNFNVKNGKICSADLSYIFNFKNNKYSGSNIKFNIDNVECVTSGVKTTPLFMKDVYNIQFNATNCKFISNSTSNQRGDYGVGAYINSESEFNFNNCYFEGGDGVYVKRGNVNLNGCALINSGLVSNYAQNVDDFSAVGACLTADSHTTKKGVSEFAITIKNCSMQSKSSFKMICVIETEAETGLGLNVSNNSLIDVQSCVFNNNPTAITIPQYDIIKYPNGQAPQNNGSQTWVCGDWTQTISE